MGRASALRGRGLTAPPYAPRVDGAGAVVIAAASLVLVATVISGRGRLPTLAVDGLVAASAAGIAAGGLRLLDDVGLASWIVAPTVLGISAALHVRALFAGDGPFRI